MEEYTKPDAVEYRGKKMSLYEAEQTQRSIERNIRRWKRENNAMKAAGLDTTESAAKVKLWNDRYKDFCAKTGLKQQKQRTVSYAHLAQKSVATAGGNGIITGARITDPLSKEADEFAEMYYREIRNFSTDAEKIAKNLGKRKSDIKRIKMYLFEEKSLYDEDIREWRRFDSDCAIAQSWQRLMVGKDIKPHDRILIEHELLEMQIKKENPTLEHWKAHELASMKYNYQKAADEYYGNLKKHQKNG